LKAAYQVCLAKIVEVAPFASFDACQSRPQEICVKCIVAGDVKDQMERRIAR
jgi:hypothetical protein